MYNIIMHNSYKLISLGRLISRKYKLQKQKGVIQEEFSCTEKNKQTDPIQKQKKLLRKNKLLDLQPKTHKDLDEKYIIEISQTQSFHGFTYLADMKAIPKNTALTACFWPA